MASIGEVNAMALDCRRMEAELEQRLDTLTLRDALFREKIALFREQTQHVIDQNKSLSGRVTEISASNQTTQVILALTALAILALLFVVLCL